MQDWRLDSKSGGNNRLLNGVVCGYVKPAIAPRIMHAGGAGHTSVIALDKVCEEHVLVIGGEVRHRGFKVDKVGMSLFVEHALPEHVQVYVLGFGGVIKERAANPYDHVYAIDEMFPTPKGLRFGNHPYGEMSLLSGGEACPNRRIFRSGFGFNSGPNVAGWREQAFGSLFGRIRGTKMLVAGCMSSGNVYSSLFLWDSWTLEKKLLFDEAGIRFNQLCRSTAYWPVLMPGRDGSFYALPVGARFPIIKFPYPNYEQFYALEVGFGTAPFINPFFATSTTTALYGPIIRLFDGRVMVFPRAGVSTALSFYIFDPDTETTTEKTFPAAGITVAGTSRWKQPLQHKDGKVYALPSTFPGNLTLIYDPSTDTYETSDMGIAYPRADITHTMGIPTTDGRIVYCQNGGAAVDINNLLILDTVNRTNVITDLGITKSILDTFMYSHVTGDGAAIFISATATATTNKYQYMAYNWDSGDYVLYTMARCIPAIGASATDTDKDVRMFGTPMLLHHSEAGHIYLHSVGVLTTPYATRCLHTFESPTVSYPSVYDRLLYFGYMM